MWRRSPSIFWGAVLVAVGLLLLLGNTGVLAMLNWDYVWPVFLIALGVWLIAARIGPGGAYADLDSAEPREGVQQAKLEVALGAGRVDVRAAELGDQLYRAHLEHAGASPEIKLDRATGTVRISQRFDWFMGARRMRLDAQLSQAVPWNVSCSTGAIRGTFDLATATVSGFECKTGASRIELNLPAPKGTVPIRIEGGALTVDVVRPAGAPVQVDVSGGAVQLRGDGSRQEGVGSRSWRSAGFDGSPDRYDVVVSGGAITVNVSSR